MEVAERVLEAAELADAVEVVARVLSARGAALSDVGRTYEGLALLDAAARLAEAHGLQEAALQALGQRAAYLGGDPRRRWRRIARRWRWRAGWAAGRSSSQHPERRRGCPPYREWTWRRACSTGCWGRTWPQRTLSASS